MKHCKTKVVIEVIQSSLSLEAYTFWKAIETQVGQADNLFQPLLGNIPSNIRDLTGVNKAFGLFYATAVQRKNLILTQSDLLDALTAPIPIYKYPCTDYNFSSNERPAGWVD